MHVLRCVSLTFVSGLGQVFPLGSSACEGPPSFGEGSRNQYPRCPAHKWPMTRPHLSRGGGGGLKKCQLRSEEETNRELRKMCSGMSKRILSSTSRNKTSRTAVR